MKRNLFSNWLRDRRQLDITIKKLNAADGTIAYEHESFLITRLFNWRFKKDVSDADIWISGYGTTIPEQLRSKVKNININYTIDV